MVRVIRWFHEETGIEIGYKPAGGISKAKDALVYLSLIAGAAVLVLAMLEAARGQIMQRVAIWVENRVAPEGFVRAIESTLRGRPYRMEALRDLAICRGYLSSPGALSLYDVPWVPIYIGVIFLLHPVMGWIALALALVVALVVALPSFLQILAASRHPVPPRMEAVLASRQAPRSRRRANPRDRPSRPRAPGSRRPAPRRSR